jgi:hypothetical protein
LLLEAISKLNNPKLKAQYLQKLINLLTRKENVNHVKNKPTINLSETLERFHKLKPKKINLEDLQHEVNQIKNEIKQLKFENNKLEDRIAILEINKKFEDVKTNENLKNQFTNTDSSSEDDKAESSKRHNKSNSEFQYCNIINKKFPQKWHTKVKIIIDNEFEIDVIVLVDSGVDLNCIQEGLIPTKYFEKSTKQLNSANGSNMKIKYEVNNAHVCQNNVCFKISFVLVKNMTDKVILGLPFIHLLYPFMTKEDGITTSPFGQPVKFEFISKLELSKINLLKENSISQSICLINNKRQHLSFLNEEIKFKRLEQQLNCKILQHKIKRFHELLNQEVFSNLPNVYWDRKIHVVKLPYVKDFSERNIPTKSRPIQMK